MEYNFPMDEIIPYCTVAVKGGALQQISTAANPFFLKNATKVEFSVP